MGRTISEETKGEKINIRVKESLKRDILNLQQEGPYQDLDFQDVIMILIRVGLGIESEVEKFRMELQYEAAVKKGGHQEAANG